MQLNFNRRWSAKVGTKREEITMRHVKFQLVVCAGIMLLLSGTAKAQQDYINNFAGGGPNGVPATGAPAYLPSGIAVDSAGNFYYSTQGGSTGHRVFKVTKSTGILTVLAGNSFAGYSGDGGPAIYAQLYNPSGIAVDHAGNVFIADESNCAVREVNAGTGNISTVAGIPPGCGYNADGVPATSAYLYEPTGVAIDKNGNLFIADYYNQRIRMVSCVTVTSSGGTCTPNSGQTAGDIYTVAGSGSAVYNGDGIAATTANLYYPYGVAVDTQGNLYIADTDDQLVRRVACGTGISGCVAPSGETSGDIYTIAGTGETIGSTGTAGYNGDGIAATTAELYQPATLTVDNSGNLFIGDQYNQRIREVSCVTKTSSGGTCTPSTGQTAGNIYTAAGTASASYNGDSQAATSANLYYPVGVAVDSAGDLFIADYDDYRVREVPCDVSTLACTPPSGDTAQFIYTVAGNGTNNSFYGDGVPATGAELYYPTSAASDSAGNIYIADRSNCVIRKVDAGTGNISTFAGTPGVCGYGGDGGPATSANLNSPNKVAVDGSNNVYIADTYNCLIRVVSGGTISTFAGVSPSLACGYTGDGGSATSAELYYPTGIAVDGSGNVYITDQSNEAVRKVSGGKISTFAGQPAASPNYGFAGDGGPATSALLYNPIDVAVDSAGNVYISDYNNLRIRKVNGLGIISTYAGNGAAGFTGDGGAANETSLYFPLGVATDTAGDLIIGDQDNYRVRLVDGQGNIHTIAGNGTPGFYGENVLATTAHLYYPYGVGVDPAGNIYEVDYYNFLIRKINALAELNSSPSSVVFDTQQVGTTSPAATVTLLSAGPLTISSITPSANFTEVDDCPGSLSNGANCTVDVYFSPTSAGIINGTLTIVDNAFFNSPLVINLQGTATGLTIAPNPLNFGTQPEGTPVAQNVTITGSTTYAATSATLSGDTTDFSITSNTCTGTKSSCVIGITFNPSSTSPVKATLAIHDSDPTSAQLVTITGTGCTSCAGPLETFTPSSVNFPPQSIKTSSPGTKVTFTNNTTGSLMITKMVPSTGFKVSVTGITGLACSITASTTVPAGGSCSFYVIFSPTVSGNPVTGTVKTTFPPDAKGNASLTLPVSGEGEPVSFTPNPVIFKPVFPNTSATNTKVTFKNIGTATLTLTSLTPSPSSNYAINYTGLTTGNCSAQPLVLAASATCTFNVAFTPGSTLGVINGTVTANFTGDPHGVAQMVLNVSGTVTEVSLSPATLAFGTVATTKTLSVTVKNVGTTTLTFSSAPTVTGTGAANFAVQPYNASPATSTCLNPTPVMLTQNQTCTYTVTFTNAGGTTSFTTYLNIFDNGGGSPQLEKMTATD